jgi:cysteinyl-tRNA synthetase
MNFTWEALEGANSALIKLHKQFLDLGSKNGKINASYKEQFEGFINDDLDTAKAIALLHELMGDESINKKDKRVTILDMNRVLGIGFIESYKQMETMLAGENKKIEVKEAPEQVQELVKEREEARKDEDWKTADSLRNKIAKKGFDVSDTDEGTELTKK